VSDKYAFIDAEYAAAGAPTIERMCRWLQVSRSGYYEWLHRPPSATAQRRQLLKIKIEALFEACDGTYGYRRLHEALLGGGEPVGPELVRELMRELGLVACQPRPFRATTVQGGEQTAVPDLVGRDFTADAPGRRLVGDITYIRTWAGWLYLATVIDCFNREVIGYAMADHMRTSLVAEALGMAARNHRLAAGCIFHSDRGTQYTSTEFAAKLAALHIRQSLGPPGVVTIMRWPNPFSRHSKMSGSIAPSIRPGTKPSKILPTTLKSSIIGGDSTQRCATEPPTRYASNT
jgi:putative transposase